MKIVAIIQSRMKSDRLPGKAFSYIAGQPVLWHITQRLKHAGKLDNVVIATGDGNANNRIALWGEQNAVPVLRGPEDDVLERLRLAAKETKADAIVRICADRVLIDPKIVDKVVDTHLSDDSFDYVCNNYPDRTYPDGLDVEIFPAETIERLCKLATEPRHREHAPTYIWDNAGFLVRNVTHSPDLSHYRWTLDYPEDLGFLRKVFYELWKEQEMFYMDDVVELLEKHPEILEINAMHNKTGDSR